MMHSKNQVQGYGCKSCVLISAMASMYYTHFMSQGTRCQYHVDCRDMSNFFPLVLLSMKHSSWGWVLPLHLYYLQKAFLWPFLPARGQIEDQLLQTEFGMSSHTANLQSVREQDSPKIFAGWKTCLDPLCFLMLDQNVQPGFISYPQWAFPWEGILAGVHMSEALTPGLWAGCLLWAWQHRDRSEVTTGDHQGSGGSQCE